MGPRRNPQRYPLPPKPPASVCQSPAKRTAISTTDDPLPPKSTGGTQSETIGPLAQSTTVAATAPEIPVATTEEPSVPATDVDPTAAPASQSSTTPLSTGPRLIAPLMEPAVPASSAMVPGYLDQSLLPPLFDPSRVCLDEEVATEVPAESLSQDTQHQPPSHDASSAVSRSAQQASLGSGAAQLASAAETTSNQSGAAQFHADKGEPGQYDTGDQVVLEEPFAPDELDPRNPVFRHPRGPPRPKDPSN